MNSELLRLRAAGENKELVSRVRSEQSGSRYNNELLAETSNRILL